MLNKIRDDVKCDYDTPLAWAVSAKNNLMNHNGFSPAQLFFGRNCNLPRILNNNLPALETPVQAFDLSMHLSSLNRVDGFWHNCCS